MVRRADHADSPMGRAKNLDHGFVRVLAARAGEIMQVIVFGIALLDIVVRR